MFSQAPNELVCGANKGLRKGCCHFFHVKKSMQPIKALFTQCITDQPAPRLNQKNIDEINQTNLISFYIFTTHYFSSNEREENRGCQ